MVKEVKSLSKSEEQAPMETITRKELELLKAKGKLYDENKAQTLEIAPVPPLESREENKDNSFLCEKCQSPVPENAVRCPSCGIELEWE